MEENLLDTKLVEEEGRISDILSSLSSDQRSLALDILKEYRSTGKSNLLESLYYDDYIEIPVDINTFIDSSDYLGWYTNCGKDIYPYWRSVLNELFVGNYNQYTEAAFTGSIGCGKSSIAVLSLAYILYKIMCLKNPHEFYHIAKGSNIYIVFFNATLSLSNSVAYTRFQNALQNSPWFKRNGKITGTKYPEYTPDLPIRFTVGSRVEHTLGKDVVGGLLDEVNYVKGADIHYEQSRIMDTYNNILERMSSRFMINGRIAGMLFVVSSKKSEYDFIESYIREQSENKSVYVADAKLWEVKPEGTYSGKTFKVAVGGSNLPSRIVNDDEDCTELIRIGYDIVEPPIEFKSRFEFNIEAALKNIAGISVASRSKYFTYYKISNNYKGRSNPFESDILEIGLNDDKQILDYMNSSVVPNDIKSKPIFIHIDTSYKNDITGISAVASLGRVSSINYTDSGDYSEGTDLYYYHIFTVGIKAPKSSEISFSKTRKFIYSLRNLGWNIIVISTDGYNSVDTRQQLILNNFRSELISLDRNDSGYSCLRSVMTDSRIDLISISRLEEELIQLERDNVSGKIDHPLLGSKDLSDSLAGAVYSAQINTDMSMMNLLDLARSTIIDNESTESTIIESDGLLKTNFVLDDYRVVSSLSDVVTRSDDSIILW